MPNSDICCKKRMLVWIIWGVWNACLYASHMLSTSLTLHASLGHWSARMTKTWRDQNNNFTLNKNKRELYITDLKSYPNCISKVQEENMKSTLPWGKLIQKLCILLNPWKGVRNWAAWPKLSFYRLLVHQKLVIKWFPTTVVSVWVIYKVHKINMGAITSLHYSIQTS